MDYSDPCGVLWHDSSLTLFGFKPRQSMPPLFRLTSVCTKSSRKVSGINDYYPSMWLALQLSQTGPVLNSIFLPSLIMRLHFIFLYTVSSFPLSLVSSLSLPFSLSEVRLFSEGNLNAFFSKASFCWRWAGKRKCRAEFAPCAAWHPAARR